MSDKERLAQIEKDLERDGLTELDLMRYELEILTIKSKVLHSMHAAAN